MDAKQVAIYIAQFANDEGVKNELKQLGLSIVPNSLSQLVGKLEGAGYVVMKKEMFEQEYAHTSLIEQTLANMEFEHNEMMQRLSQQQPTMQPITGEFNPNWQPTQTAPINPTFGGQMVHTTPNGIPNFENFSPLEVLNQTIQEGEAELAAMAKANEKKQLVDPFSDNNLLIIEGENKEVNFKDFGNLKPVSEGDPFQTNPQQSKDPFAQSPYGNEKTFGVTNTSTQSTTVNKEYNQSEFKHVSPELPETNEIEKMWKEFLQKATHSEPISFTSLILNAKPISFDDNILKLSYNSTQTYQMKQIKSKKEQLITLFAREMGQTIDFAFELSEKQ